MSDLTVSVTNQTVTVSPSTQALTVTVPYSNTATVSSLDDLSDVAFVGVANGYILRYNGTAWSGVPGSTYFAAASHTHPQSDVTGLVTFVSNTNSTLLDQADLIGQAQFDISALQTAPPAHTHSYSDIMSGYPSLTSAQNVLSGSTVSLCNSTCTSLGSVTLAAGTWLVQSTVTVQHSTGTEKVATRIGTSSSTYASTEQRTAAANINMSMALASVITIASSTTIHHYGIATSSTGTSVQYQTSIPSGSVVSSATLINAVRIA